MGARAVENYLVNQFISEHPVKITFYLRQGILWDFQKLFKRVRYLLLTAMQSPNISITDTQDDVDVLIRRSRSFMDDRGVATIHQDHEFIQVVK